DPDENWAGRVWLLHIEAVLAMHDRRTADACAIFDRLRVLATQLQILEPCIVPWAGDAITAYLHGLRMDDARAVLASLESMASVCRAVSPGSSWPGARPLSNSSKAISRRRRA